MRARRLLIDIFLQFFALASARASRAVGLLSLFGGTR